MRVRIIAPATSANLGPGFDILALALQLQSEVRAETSAGGAVSVDPGDDAPAELRDPETNLVTRAYVEAAAAMNVTPVGAHFRCALGIPVARGLGSSAAATLSGVLAAVALHQAPWDEQAVIDFAARLEGHRDNVAAAMLGGLAVCAPGAPAVTVPVPDDLRAVVFVPGASLRTDGARRVVPTTFSREDAVFNAARCALLVRALLLADHAALGVAMDDRWHQAARGALIPFASPLIAAAREAGASGAALSGAGPSVIALVAERASGEVAAALQRTSAAHGVDGAAMVLAVRNYGTRVDLRP